MSDGDRIEVEKEKTGRKKEAQELGDTKICSRYTYHKLVSHIPHVLLELHSETPGSKFDKGS